jgi:zinc protease
VEALIREHFTEAKAAAGDSGRPDFGSVPAGTGLRTKLHTEPQAKSVSISIEIPRQVEPVPDTAAERRKKLVRSLADAVINQRLSRLVKKPDAPVLGASAYSYEYLEFLHTSGISADCEPSKWEEALRLIERELRRALEHGFTAAEFEEAVASVRQQVKLRADQASTRRSRDLADALVIQLSARRVFTHPSDDLERVAAELDGVTAAGAHAALKADWNSDDIQIFVGGNLELPGVNAEEKIAAVFNESRGQPVEAPAEDAQAAFAYTEFGPPGEIVERKVVEDLEVTQAVFANQVRVSIKPTPFEKGTIRVLANFGGGKLSAPKGKPGLIPFAQSTFILGGLEAHDVDELRRLFAGKTVGTDFSVGDGAFLLAGRTTPEDLEAQLQLLAAHLVAPGFRTEAQEQFRRGLAPMYAELSTTPEGVMADRVSKFLHQGDERFGYPEREVMESRDLKEAKAWLLPELRESWLEVSIVGDVEPDAALKALAATFGALPARAREKPAYEKERQVALPTPPASEVFHFQTEIPKAVAAVYWPTADMSDIQRTRRLTVLSSVLDDRLRLKVREELGETYSPACYHVANDTFTGFGYMTAMVEVKPGQADNIRGIVTEIADEVAKGPISQDEFERAMKPLMSQLEQMRRDNRYWSQNVLRNCHEHPERLDWARAIITDFQAITLEEIQKLAAEFLPSSRVVTASVIPQS